MPGHLLLRPTFMPVKNFLIAMLALSVALPHVAVAHDAAAEMAEAANNLLATLTPDQKAKATFKVEDAERKNWHYIPRERKGLPFKELTPTQRLLAHALLSSGLSHRGYGKAVSIMSLDDILKELEQGKGPVRDPELYFISIFGTPGGKEIWGWRVEGHHLSLNFTTADGLVTSSTPSFLGTNPGEVKSGPRAGMRVLGREEDLGFELINSLDEKQRKVAVLLDKVPADILNLPGRNDWTKHEGLPQSAMTAPQKATLLKLIHEYIDRVRPDLAAEDWAKIEKAGLKKIYFAWAGSLKPGEGHYYRVQGPTFVLELDNTQNNANHVHAVWRDFDHDFGEDLLKEHYETGHHAPR